MNQQIFEVEVTCPKCRENKNFDLTEMWKGHQIVWRVEGGVLDKSKGNLDPGDPYQVQAYCHNCDHRWTIRKTLQITDLLKPPTTQPTLINLKNK